MVRRDESGVGLCGRAMGLLGWLSDHLYSSVIEECAYYRVGILNLLLKA